MCPLTFNSPASLSYLSFPPANPVFLCLFKFSLSSLPRTRYVRPLLLFHLTRQVSAIQLTLYPFHLFILSSLSASSSCFRYFTPTLCPIHLFVLLFFLGFFSIFTLFLLLFVPFPCSFYSPFSPSSASLSCIIYSTHRLLLPPVLSPLPLQPPFPFIALPPTLPLFHLFSSPTSFPKQLLVLWLTRSLHCYNVWQSQFTGKLW